MKSALRHRCFLPIAFLFIPVFPLFAQTTFPSTFYQPPWVNPQPDVPYLPNPATRPADWIVEHDPVVPNASPEARALLKFLYEISGKHTLTGQHNYAAEQGYSTQLMT